MADDTEKRAETLDPRIYFAAEGTSRGQLRGIVPERDRPVWPR